jgi:YidC/Oxa1 family membrane protein insertase
MVWSTVFGSESKEFANATHFIPVDSIPSPSGKNEFQERDNSMNKKDLVPVVLLALLIPVYIFIDRTFIAPKFADNTPPAVEQPAETNATAVADTPSEIVPATDTPAAAPVKLEVPEEEQLAELNNGKLHIELTSLGGGIKSVTLIDKAADGQYLYPEFNEKDSGPVLLDFEGTAALAYEGIDGIGINNSLATQVSEDGKSVTFTKPLESGLLYQRTLTVGEDYLLTVNDKFINQGSGAVVLPAARIVTGRMENPADMKSMKGVSILGVDTFADNDVRYWGKKINKLYKNANKAPSIDEVPEDMNGVFIDWVSAKNKFFTQIIKPENTTATMSVLSNRDMSEKGIVPTDIAATLNYAPVSINAGSTYELNYAYYIGPKNYSILKAASDANMEKVMEFETIGFWSFMNIIMEPARRFLLWALNIFFGITKSYGIAIILLTVLIRILFWPLTHKSTQKMRENSEKMQEVQPKVKAVQEKFKGDPQRIQQETMKIYQEHGFNPMAMMGGCLPMMLQMPVFFALFTVLRNAIELRYAGFLWIADLSQPENLFAGSIPFIGALNILPILMSVSMIFQQKLSQPANPSATPEQVQQQKMMMYMMPIMMLFFFYSMPSGLTMYWTTSNLLMIIQTTVYNYRKKRKEA